MTLTLGLADRAYVMSNGEVIFSGNAASLAGDHELQVRLLGV